MTSTILIGDVLEQLALMPAESVDCVVTSPPYWGLRDYDVEGQIGLEPTLGEHLDVMVRVFRAVWRVLKQHGTCWVNYGDCYAAQPNGKSAAAYKAEGTDDRTFRDKPFSTVGPIYSPDHHGDRGERGNVYRRKSGVTAPGGIQPGGTLKPKDLCMIPNRLAIALQDDGWWVRSEIIWHKPNPMPESVYDRPTTAHEKIWMLTKGEDYYYDHEAIREPVTGGAKPRKAGSRKPQGPITKHDAGRAPANQRTPTPAGWDTEAGAHGTIHRAGRSKVAAEADPFRKNKPSFAAATGDLVESRNARNVWKIAPKPFRDAHFATFPPALAERCIKAGTPRTVCAACGAVQGCGGICEVFGRVPGKVLDPFGGAGTVGLVAERLGLDSVLIELNPDYAEMARLRIAVDRPAIPEAAE